MQLHIFFSGKVQGVFMRARTKELADNFGTTGWIKNLPDGRVELLAEGKEENINKLLDELGNRFPSKTETHWQKSTQNQYQNFNILY